MTTSDPNGLSSTLRKAIVASGLTYSALERETGAKRASIMRFVRGDGELRLDIAGRLAAHLGLVLRPIKQIEGE